MIINSGGGTCGFKFKFNTGLILNPCRIILYPGLYYLNPDLNFLFRPGFKLSPARICIESILI